MPATAARERPAWMPENWTPPVVETKRKRGRKAKTPLEVAPRDEDFSKRDDEEEGEEAEVTRELVMNTVVIVFQGLATLVDESFEVLDKEHKPLPHVDQAVNEMMPWMKIYGGPLTRMMPWIGLVAGLQILSSRAIDPVAEIIAGVRKPRCMRENPKDVYTDKAKEMFARRAAAAGQGPQA